MDVKTMEGSTPMTLLFIPDPCSDPLSNIPTSAPSITCKNGVIENAYISKGEVAIGFLNEEISANHEYPSDRCEQRRVQEWNGDHFQRGGRHFLIHTVVKTYYIQVALLFHLLFE